MSNRRYKAVCKDCNKNYIAKKVDSTFCSDGCRANWHYSKKVEARLSEMAKGGEVVLESKPIDVTHDNSQDDQELPNTDFKQKLTFQERIDQLKPITPYQPKKEVPRTITLKGY